jgi:hypothetical protein
MSADWWRLYYDLPAKRFVGASFEIRFGWPQLDPRAVEKSPALVAMRGEIVNEISRLLSVGIQWCASPDSGELAGKDPEERRAILEAMEFLSPSQTGTYIEQIQIGGALARVARPVPLTKTTRRQVKGRLEVERAPIAVEVVAVGAVDAVDLGLQRFTLRHVTDREFFPHSDTPRRQAGGLFPALEFEYSDEQAEAVWEAFDSRKMVVVHGRARLPELYVLRFISIIGSVRNGDRNRDEIKGPE